MTDVWRYACPKGHRDIRRKQSGYMSKESEVSGYSCRTCGKRYEGNPRDMKKEYSNEV